MYMVGQTKTPVTVQLIIPSEWEIATGMNKTRQHNTFRAASVADLVDCPFLVGKFKSWAFENKGVKHHIAYWLLPNAVAFNESKLIAAIKKVVNEAGNIFKHFPYRSFTFLLQDGAYGALEHASSVTLGIPASRLDDDFADYLNEICHEYFHTWNLVRIKPVEYGDISYKKQPLSKGLWFSEGFTMYYADLVALRAGLPISDTSRIKHLERLIRRYYNSPGHRSISPEKVSMAEYGPAGMLGDYSGSSHLQGELIALMLDLFIIDATKASKSMDDVMREMMRLYSAEKGFTTKGVEEVVSKVSGRDMHQFFKDQVSGNMEFKINDYLALMGWQFTLSWKEATDQNGKQAADLRIFPLEEEGESTRIGITDPEGIWAKAGIHTGDVVISINEQKIGNRNDLWKQLRSIKLGDEVKMEIMRPAGVFKTTVLIGSYKQPVVELHRVANPSIIQQKVESIWLEGL
jgi:predicted metalloprotease with PDZ domain